MRQKNPLSWGWVDAKTVRSVWGMLALGWCTSTLSGAPPAAASAPARPARPASISSITFERNCYGCANGSVLVLQADGQARYTVTGHARLGTIDQTHTGTVSTQDFQALARLIERQRFFELQDSYADPQWQDGAWTALRVVRGTQDKQVFNRNGAGPAALQTLERGVDALQTRIKFVPEPR